MEYMATKRTIYQFDLSAFKQSQKLLGLSIETVADAMGVTPRTVYNINSGVSSPKVQNLLRFCNHFGIDVRQFWLETVAV